MTIVIDTNVMLSGLVWDGVPFEVIAACIEGRAVLAISPEILAEYEQVGQEFQKGHPSVFNCQPLAGARTLLRWATSAGPIDAVESCGYPTE